MTNRSQAALIHRSRTTSTTDSRGGKANRSRSARTNRFRTRPLLAAATLVVASASLAGCSDGVPLHAGDLIRPAGGVGDFEVMVVADGLAHPWGIAFLPGGDILVTERPGRLRMIQDGRLLPDPISGVPEVVARGQGGLLDVTLHPDFAENRLVYLSYSKDVGSGRTTTAVARGVLDGMALTSVEEVIETAAVGSPGRHYGSRLDFDRDGYLFITVGDRGDMNRAQDLSDHVGTTLRLHDDGRVPDDNPFVGEEGVLPEIFTWGNRNAQGQAVHPETGQIWQNEHGPRGGDEVNLILAGRNYGWPAITHGVDYSGRQITPDTAREGMEQPILHWTPSIAVSGMDFYTGDAFSDWQGNLFVGALRHQHIRRLTMDGDRIVDQEVLLADLNKRIREVATGPDGYLYLLTDQGAGQVLRIQPAAAFGQPPR